MKNLIPSEWLSPSSLQEASNIQYQLAERVILEDDFSSLHLIGGMDVSHNLYDPQSIIHASAVILNSSLQLEEKAGVSDVQLFPYIPGFLGFREAPVLVKAFEKLSKRPDIILVDGHGISHPRRLGIASHIGVLLNIPTIGVAKSLLVGHPLNTLGEKKGDSTPLIWKGESIGVLVRTKIRCKPLIISAGHRISQQTALEIVLKCITQYRLPEPTRQAHLIANEYRIQSKKTL